jgi:hypothetical protein
VEVVKSDTGEVIEVDSIGEAVGEIDRPPHWRKARIGAGFYIEGEWGKEFEKAFFEAQKKIGSGVQVDSENEFNKSRYASLRGMLSKIQPILHENGFSIRQGTGRLSVRGDLGQKAFLPVWLQLTHVDTLQWQCVTIEMPLTKFDAQSQKAAFTFGRRCDLEGYFSLAPSDDDDGVQASHEVTPEDKQRMLSSMLKKIEDCKTPLDLRTWAKANEQQVQLLGEDDQGKLRDAWQNRLNDLSGRLKAQNKKV